MPGLCWSTHGQGTLVKGSLIRGACHSCKKAWDVCSADNLASLLSVMLPNERHILALNYVRPVNINYFEIVLSYVREFDKVRLIQ